MDVSYLEDPGVYIYIHMHTQIYIYIYMCVIHVLIGLIAYSGTRGPYNLVISTATFMYFVSTQF